MLGDYHHVTPLDTNTSTYPIWWHLDGKRVGLSSGGRGSYHALLQLRRVVGDSPYHLGPREGFVSYHGWRSLAGCWGLRRWGLLGWGWGSLGKRGASLVVLTVCRRRRTGLEVEKRKCIYCH